jgi:hypothetical protein
LGRPAPNWHGTSPAGFATLLCMGTFQLLEECRHDIESVGFTVAAITGDVTGCDWAYSVGLHRTFEHPELVLVGLDAPLAGAVVQSLADKVAAGARLRPGAEARLGPLRFRFREVDDVFCSQSDWFNLGREVTAAWGARWPSTLQVLWADADGHFPEAVDDPAWFLRQPLLAPPEG